MINSLIPKLGERDEEMEDDEEEEEEEEV